MNDVMKDKKFWQWDETIKIICFFFL